MLQRFRDQFGTAGLVVGVVALIAALAGTAIAASGLNSKQKKQVTSIAKKYAGKDGAPGAKGDKGDKGDTGSAGNNGNNGNNGADGQSVEVVPAGGACLNGGSSFKVGNVVKGSACNGEDGEDGETGFTEVLPSGKTETGSWGGQFAEGPAITVLSIPIPLPSDPTPVFVGTKKTEKEKGESEGCDGIVSGLPAADPGKLCVYVNNEIGTLKENAEKNEKEVMFLDPQVSFTPGTAPNGAAIFFTCEAPQCVTYGSWAATAP